MGRQLVLDISILGRAGGQAVGIVRVARELARSAHAHRKDTLFVIYDSRIEAFRLVAPAYLESIIAGTLIVDLSGQPDRSRTRPTLTDRAPQALKGLSLWLRNPRRRVIFWLEGQRLKGGARQELADWAQSRLLSPQRQLELYGAEGKRRSILAFDMVVGPVLTLASTHDLVGIGSDWDKSVTDHIAQSKARTGVRTAFICYDVVPLLYPHFYPPGSAEKFRQMFHRVVGLVDLLFVTATQIAADVTSYCQASDLPVPLLEKVQLGADAAVAASDGQVDLPAGLTAGRYGLFVSTIEPRKGHQFLFSVWKALLEKGIPQAVDFKLVFCGRQGWLVDDFVREMESDPSYGNSLIVLSGVDDRWLANLYRNAAFGVFPSLYEGYGLPIVELYRHGKTALSSNGGALREVAGEFARLLEPRDADAWFNALKEWIEDPTLRLPYERAIAERFSHPSWVEASSAFFDAVDRKLTGATRTDEPGPLHQRETGGA